MVHVVNHHVTIMASVFQKKMDLNANVWMDFMEFYVKEQQIIVFLCHVIMEAFVPPCLMDTHANVVETIMEQNANYVSYYDYFLIKLN